VPTEAKVGHGVYALERLIDQNKSSNPSSNVAIIYPHDKLISRVTN